MDEKMIDVNIPNVGDTLIKLKYIKLWQPKGIYRTNGKVFFFVDGAGCSMAGCSMAESDFDEIFAIDKPVTGVTKAIKKFYDDKVKRGWSKGFFFFDIHGTILKPNYSFGNTPTEFYPYAKEALQFISTLHTDIVMCIYTCSHPNEIEEYLKLFGENNIRFTWVNENPEVPTDVNGYGCYDKKPYMNVLFEDKAGFSGEEDWLPVLTLMKEYYPNIV